jgi:glycosyltransferase involved in cell wall biosynthesis
MHLNIATFLDEYPKGGGPSTAVRGLSRALARQSHQITIYGCGGELSGADPVEPAVRIRTFDGSSNPFRIAARLNGLLSENAAGHDLLVINGIFNPRNVAVAKAARRGGIPYIVCPHSMFHPDLLNKNRIRKLVYGQLFERPLLNRAAAVHVFSDDQVRMLRNYGVHRPAIVVANGLDAAEITSTQDNAAVEISGDPKLTYIGRMDAHTKGLDLLLEGLARAVQAGAVPPSLRINMVGPDWGDQKSLQRLATALGVQEYVVFLGEVNEAARWTLLRYSDLILVPSRHDAFPTVVLESMAMGKPVIVSRQTGTANSVVEAKCGLIAEASAESIAAKLRQALEQRSSWKSMGDAGRRYVLEHMTWANRAHELAAHYARAIGKTAGANNVLAEVAR